MADHSRVRRGAIRAGVAAAVLTSAVIVGVGFALAWHVGSLPVKSTQDVAAESGPLFAAAGVFTSVVLAWVTGYYAWQNREMVAEMRAARQLSVRPHVYLALQPVGPTIVVARVHNVGPGTATDLNVTVRFVGTEGHPDDVRTVQDPVLAPGAHHDLMPEDHAGRILDIDRLAEAYTAVHVTGSVRDALGEIVPVSHGVDNLPAWRAALVAARIQWDEAPSETAVRHLQVIADEMKKVAHEAAEPRVRRNSENARRRRLRDRRRERIGRLPGGIAVLAVWDRASRRQR